MEEENDLQRIVCRCWVDLLLFFFLFFLAVNINIINYTIIINDWILTAHRVQLLPMNPPQRDHHQSLVIHVIIEIINECRTWTEQRVAQIGLVRTAGAQSRRTAWGTMSRRKRGKCR